MPTAFAVACFLRPLWPRRQDEALIFGTGADWKTRFEPQVVQEGPCSCHPCGGSPWRVPVENPYGRSYSWNPCGGSLLQLQGSNREWWWWPQEDILTGVTRKLIRVGAATDIDGARGLKRWPCRAGLKRWSCMCM